MIKSFDFVYKIDTSNLVRLLYYNADKSIIKFIEHPVYKNWYFKFTENNIWELYDDKHNHRRIRSDVFYKNKTIFEGRALEVIDFITRHDDLCVEDEFKKGDYMLYIRTCLPTEACKIMIYDYRQGNYIVGRDPVTNVSISILAQQHFVRKLPNES